MRALQALLIRSKKLKSDVNAEKATCKVYTNCLRTALKLNEIANLEPNEEIKLSSSCAESLIRVCVAKVKRILAIFATESRLLFSAQCNKLFFTCVSFVDIVSQSDQPEIATLLNNKVLGGNFQLLISKYIWFFTKWMCTQCAHSFLVSHSFLTHTLTHSSKLQKSKFP